MNILTFIENAEAFFELVFFILTMYFLVIGLRTRDYKNLKRYGCIYLMLNFLRRIYTYFMQKSMTVSIIGGTDGPTSIFLAGRVGGTYSMILYLISLIIILLIVGILIYMRRKK